MAESAKKTKFYAVWNGRVFDRTSARPYTHAAVYKGHDGEEFVGSFHGTAALAAKGTNGWKPIAVVEVTTEVPVLATTEKEQDTMAASTAKKATAAPKVTAAEAKHIRTREEIAGILERIPSLVEAENAEGIATLKGEAEELIQTLPTGEKTKLRADLDAAVKAEPAPKPSKEVAKKAEAKVDLQGDYHNFEGVAELVDQAAAKVLELAKSSVSGGLELANITFYAWTRITKADGMPDLNGETQAAKAVTTDAFDKVLKGLPEEGKNEEADHLRAQLGSVRKSMQNAREDVRVAYIRGLEHTPEEAARFGKITEGKEKAELIEAVAKVYGTTLLTRAEKAALARKAKKEIAAAEEKFTEAQANLAEVEAEAAAKVEAEEMTEEEAADARAAAQTALAEAAAAMEAAKKVEGAPKPEATPEEALTDALNKIAKLAPALRGEAVKGLDAKKKDALRKKASDARDALVALLGNW